MNSLTDFALNEEYKHIQKLGDKLAEIDSLIDWETFRPIVNQLYHSNSAQGGRPNTDEVLLVKMVVLQSHSTVSQIPNWKGRQMIVSRSENSLDFLIKFQISQQYGISGNG